jgi:hypothetical protein
VKIAEAAIFHLKKNFYARVQFPRTTKHKNLNVILERAG